MELKQVDFCILAIDVSGSMEGTERIGKVNAALKQFEDFSKKHPTISKRLFISIIEFSNETKTHLPKLSCEFRFPTLKEGGSTDLNKGLSKAIDELKRWKRKHLPTSKVSNLYFVLITDLKAAEIEESSEDNDWLKKLKKLGRKSNFTFFGFGVDGGNLDLLKDSFYPNFIINEDLEISSLFDAMKKRIEKDNDKTKYKAFWDKLISLGSPLDWRINNFFGKIIQRELKLKGIGISIWAFSIFGGFQLIKIAIEFSVECSIEETYHEERERMFNDYQTLKNNNEITQNSNLNVELMTERKGMFFSSVKSTLIYTYIDSLDNFIKGEYRMDSSNSLFQSGLLIQKSFNEIVKKHFSDAEEVFVIIQGEADGYKILKPIRYKGEYGDLDFYLENNQHVRIKNGELFKSNVKLGLLRGVSFWTFLRGREDLFSKALTEYVYRYKTNATDYGGKYRKVIISITIN